MPGFIITRFTHGSGGKFLTSVIQTSNTVDHWSTVLQNHKHDDIFPLLLKHYFDRSFPFDHSQALRNEPHCPYRTDLYSSSYPRGDDVTIEQFLSHAHQIKDVRFLDGWHQDRLVNLILNKPEIPRFCDNQAVITITIESEAEQQWVCETLWSKHWIELGTQLIYAPDDPEYCHISRLAEVLKYNNQSRWNRSEKSALYEHFVAKNHTKPWYTDRHRFAEFDQQHALDNVFVPLCCFFDRDRFVSTIESVCDHFGLASINLDLVDTMRSIWTSRQIPFDA